MYTPLAYFLPFWVPTGTEDLLEEIVGRFDDSPFQAALPPGHIHGGHSPTKTRPTALWISDKANGAATHNLD
jgi:hypothetical protein